MSTPRPPRRPRAWSASYTAADLGDLAPVPPPLPFLDAGFSRPWLVAVGERVHFVGDLVAVVLTEERYQGEDAAELVVVDIDPLPAVVGTAAAKTDETVLFPGVGTNTVAAFGEPAPADFFADCEVVVRREIVNQRVAAAPLETRAASAAWGEDGRVTIWCTNQGAQQAKGQIAGWLGLDPTLVHLITPDVGGGFGAKIGADQEYAFVAWLAQQAGRPVRWTESRSENMTGMLQGRAQDQVITIGGSPRRPGAGLQPGGRPGLRRLPAHRDRAPDADHAHGRRRCTTSPRCTPRPPATSPTAPRSAPTAAPVGPRRPPPSSGPWTCSPPRSAWTPPTSGGRTSSRAFTEPTQTSSGATYDSGDYEAALDRVLQAAGYAELRAEQARRRERGDIRQLGIGVSAYVEITGAGQRPGDVGERRARGARRRHGDRPHRHLAARPGPRHDLGDAGQRAAGHPGGEDHRAARRHRPDPRRRRHHGLAVACSRAGPRCTRPPSSWSRWPASGPPSCWRPTPTTSRST